MFKKTCWIAFLIVFSCKSKVEKIKPIVQSISESIYASGKLKSKNQYEGFVTVNGNIDQIFVSEGDTVATGTPILSISNQTQKLNKENAELSAEFADYDKNLGKLIDAKSMIYIANNKLKNDSALFFRQKELWNQQVGSKIEYEARELAYQNSKASFYSATLKYKDLQRQLKFNASQSKKNLLITSNLESDYTMKSEIDGIVYSLNKKKGEIVNPQIPLAVIGDAKNFTLEMQVDEYDILKVTNGQLVIVTMDSYKNKVFKATVTKIYPLMNVKSKTFLVEATFTNPPAKLYPNISFEANIVLHTKEKSMLIPRSFLLNDSLVVKSNGDKVAVKTGLKDYQMVEILSGISVEEELQKPKQ